MAKLSGFKSFRFQSSHFRFWIQNLLCVNGKTNPVLKRSKTLTKTFESGTISSSVNLVYISLFDMYVILL